MTLLDFDTACGSFCTGIAFLEAKLCVLVENLHFKQGPFIWGRHLKAYVGGCAYTVRRSVVCHSCSIPWGIEADRYSPVLDLEPALLQWLSLDHWSICQTD